MSRPDLRAAASSWSLHKRGAVSAGCLWHLHSQVLYMAPQYSHTSTLRHMHVLTPHSHTSIHTHIHSHTHPHTPPHTLTRSHSGICTCSHPHSHPYSHPHTHAHSHTAVCAMETVQQVLKKLNVEGPCALGIPLLGTDPKELKERPRETLVPQVHTSQKVGATQVSVHR